MREAYTRLYRQIGDCVLGTDPDQRVRISRSLTAAALYGVFLLLMFCSVQLGLTKVAWDIAATAYTVAGPVLFYAMLRSGLNQRFSDPGMTVVQMLFGVTTLVLAYAGNPVTRGSILLILALVMVFGMFSLTPGQARGLTWFTLAVFAVAMFGLSGVLPQVYDWRLELLHFLVLLVALPTIAAVAGQLARMRQRRREQRAALQQALEQLEGLVRYDTLTGLVNRRCMLERLAQETSRRSMDAAPACICMIDLDHFKRINDNFGHAAGDEVLQRFARQALSILRAGDVLARWGGEEFLLLLPDATAQQACRAMERLRVALADPRLWQDRPELEVTLSAGVAVWQQGEAAAQAIERADQQAYRAKAAGRNRCMCDGLALDVATP